MRNTNQLRLRAHTRRTLHRLRRRDPVAELITQKRARLEHELTALDNALHAAQVEYDAAELRYRHAVTAAAERRTDLSRQLALLTPTNPEETQ